MEKEDMPEEIAGTILLQADQELSDADKLRKAREIVCDDTYQDIRNEIKSDVTECMNGLLEKTRNSQRHAITVFSDMYRKLEIGVAVLSVLMLLMCLVVRRLVVKPLISYNESIKKGVIFPVMGAEELQTLVETCNQVFTENQEAQKLIRHEAEHDSLTDLLNRGSFDKIYNIYERGDRPFALILADVDTFKSVNDTHGHASGDAILKKVPLF